MKSKRYWCSWVCAESDYRPLTYPPNEKILGWWCSGYGDDGSTLCAAIEGNNESEIIKSICIDWPEFDGNFRFIEEREIGCTPLSDRFPLSDWMKPRFSKK